MLFIFLENAMNLGIFTHAPVLHSKLKAKFFENLFPPTVGEEAMSNFIALSNFNQKKWRWIGTSGYLYFAWFIIFLDVTVLQFCSGIKFIASPMQPW